MIITLNVKIPDRRFQQKDCRMPGKINEQSAVIDSITTQYNELMDIARQYRDEAIKWRSKFI